MFYGKLGLQGGVQRRVTLHQWNELPPFPPIQHGEDMILELHFIYGFMIGFEYVDQEEAKYYVLDLGIIRLMLAYPKDQHLMAAPSGVVFFTRKDESLFYQ